MLRATTLLALLCLNMGLSYGMQCSYGHKNVLSEILDSCPGLLDSSDKSYCCVDIENNRMYCCDAAEFMTKTTWLLLTVIAAAVIGVSLIVCCISCLCCSCCPWYRRRHRGTVYGKVQVPTVVHVIQSPASVPQSTQPHVTAMNATSSAEMSQPPPYAEVVYEKQAAYNPTYVTSHQQ
ncbi:uncharacterized protein LOC114873816 isoform X1 [Osmia bicornis bicornis]|uniref:uncharacterized protein LOC114873816 isoform X1 n=1 Tax=Osmia bicornis bicornis TaxID=1437191 RepID=UPI0010F9BEE4|nr:uncharacterized protein LOC114873816 isoform X1 [Osmia bicornis bicornis]